MSLLPKSRRALLAFLHDVAMAALSFALALFLRLGEAVTQYEPRLMVLYGAVFTGIAAVVFLVTGLYRGIWRYASVPDLKRIVLAVLVVALALPALFLMLLGSYVSGRHAGLAFSTWPLFNGRVIPATHGLLPQPTLFPVITTCFPRTPVHSPMSRDDRRLRIRTAR